MPSFWPRRRHLPDLADVEPLIPVDERHTNVAGSNDCALNAPRTGESSASGDYLLADNIMKAVEHLARDLAKVDMPDVQWGDDPARFKDRYRALAWAVAAVGWRPPHALTGGSPDA